MALLPSGGNDIVFTDDWLSCLIVDHFRPTGKVIDPFVGNGSFAQWMPNCDWCEIRRGRDFFDDRHVNPRYDWAVSNPPYSILADVMLRSYGVADNIVYLILANSVFGQRAKINTMIRYGYGIVEMLEVPNPDPPFPKFGIHLCAVWFRRGWPTTNMLVRKATEQQVKDAHAKCKQTAQKRKDHLHSLFAKKSRRS
jgi:hypothetical protein